MTTDLDDFRLINPCGITDKPVTSLERELEREIASPAPLPALPSIAHQAARQFGIVFSQQVLAADSLDDIRAPVSRKGQPASPQVPAEDTPLQVPSEVERLKRTPEHPFRA